MIKISRKPKSTGVRTEVFTMRFDPKLKYLAEIAARKQRRSLANFVEWAVELGLKTAALDGTQLSVMDRSSELWDVKESDRFLKLALNFPELMSYDEQNLWKFICENQEFWNGVRDSNGEFQWDIADKSKLNQNFVRASWGSIKEAVALGEHEQSMLPNEATAAKDIDLIPQKASSNSRVFSVPVTRRNKNAETHD